MRTEVEGSGGLGREESCFGKVGEDQEGGSTRGGSGGERVEKEVN